ncbi:unnamed protein product [Psylliodes chrysocephalus]|uniref:Uncharacterized protein n=1 Tax=Psylliodes chrysocephalus TaxID=3402493 RepID=A0A9P0CD45_9CUCU|nr:unnamed protein product [Psylliodes chrysocephala]
MVKLFQSKPENRTFVVDSEILPQEYYPLKESNIQTVLKETDSEASATENNVIIECPKDIVDEFGISGDDDETLLPQAGPLGVTCNNIQNYKGLSEHSYTILAHEMARQKYYTEEESRRILQESDNTSDEIEISDSESENTDTVEEQQTVLDEITVLENEGENATFVPVGKILKSKSGYEWKTQPLASTRGRAHNIVNSREDIFQSQPQREVLSELPTPTANYLSEETDIDLITDNLEANCSNAYEVKAQPPNKEVVTQKNTVVITRASSVSVPKKSVRKGSPFSRGIHKK